MPEQSALKSNPKQRKQILSSSITRVLLFTLLFSAYYILLSPIVETSIGRGLGNIFQTYSNQQVNLLTPIFDINVYAGEYSLTTAESKLNIASNTQLTTADPRVLAMNKFLTDYHSPMAPYAELFVTEADIYGLDWRIVAAVSGVESAFGNLIPLNTNNGWGWRGGPGGDWSNFPTWAEGIKEITRGLAEGYGIRMTPFQIEPIYCPPCAANPAHAWANGVTNFMYELEYYLDNLENL